MPVEICQAPGCSRPGYWEGVCTAHHQQAERAQAIGILCEVGRDFQVEEWAGSHSGPSDEGPIKVAAVPLAWQSAGATPFGQAVLRRLVERVVGTDEGQRNNILNIAAYLAGGYVAGGEMEVRTTVAALVDAAHTIGLEYREAASTVRSGIAKGMRRPLYPAR